jgi:hypothetical protein
MRVAGYLVLVLVCCAEAQTSQQLRSRYGDPYAERFVVRPGIVATVLYGRDAAGCQILIEKQKQPSPDAAQKTQYMRPGRSSRATLMSNSRLGFAIVPRTMVL